MLFPDGAGRVVLCGVGRDIYTGATLPDSSIVDHVSLDLVLDGPLRTIVDASIQPDTEGIASWLIGMTGHFRFRRQLQDAHPGFVAAGSVAALLVDEIPGATLISGSSLARSGLIPVRVTGAGPGVNVCAGWIENGSMHAGLETRPFFGEGPPAPLLDRDDDPLAWHARGDLPISSLRRQRRIDVSPRADGAFTIDVFFRDSFIEPDGTESVVHEYGLDAVVDSGDRRVLEVTATAHVLPGPECPSAIASAQRIVGVPVGDLRRLIRDEFRGTSTCTHLNDVMRSIGDVGTLIDTLERLTSP